MIYRVTMTTEKSIFLQLLARIRVNRCCLTCECPNFISYNIKMKILFLLSMMVALCHNSDSVTVMAIDLGSEWMKIAIVKPGVPMEIVLNKETKRKTEVAVALKDGVRVFGSSAVAQGVRFPKNTYFYLLDLLAKKLDNPLVQSYQQKFPYYDLLEDPVTGYVQFRHDVENNIIYSPEELLAMTLNYSRSLAEEYAQQTVDSCIITVPAYFNQAERLMLLYSAKLAGLPGPQIMDDNTAAALNYGVFRRNDINATATYIMFYDMGATSITATIVAYQVVKVNGIADPQLSVKGIGYDRTFGGLEMEFRLREHLIKLFDAKKTTKSDVRRSPKAMAKLLKEARRLKLVLSANNEHRARVESLIDDEDFDAKVTREEFEELCSDLWLKVADPVKEALSSAGITMDIVSKLILVGGGTRVPKVQDILLKESGMSSLTKSLNADEAPALGASYEAAARSKAFRVKTFHIKSGTVYPIDIEFDRVTAHENGSQTVKNVRKTLFQRNNPYPQRKVITFNRFYSDFGFYVSYGDLRFLTEDQLKIFGAKNVSAIKLQGVDIAHEKYGTNNNTESKGVKAHFRMDENGVLNLEEVESLYESNATSPDEKNNDTDDPSTFQKLKDSFSSLFGGDEEEKGSDKDSSTDEDKSKEESGSPNKEQKTAEKKNKEEFEKDVTKSKSDTTGKKASEEPADNAEKGTEEPRKSEKSADETEDKDKKANSTETANKPKKVKVSAALNKTILRLDYIEQTEDAYNTSKAKLLALAERDALKIAKEEAMNALESDIYDKQDKLYQEEYEKAMSPTEQEEVTKALREASDWMFELEDEVTPEAYKEKLKELRSLARPWLLRVKERQELVPLLKDMEIIFNYTAHFIKAVDALPEDDQIYTEVEINLLKKTYNDTVMWKNGTLKKQQLLEPSANNIMKPNDVKTKIGELNREVQYLLNKARTAKPKKKIEEPKSNSTKPEKEEKLNITQTVKNSVLEEKNENETSVKMEGQGDVEGLREKKEDSKETDDTGESQNTEKVSKDQMTNDVPPSGDKTKSGYTTATPTITSAAATDAVTEKGEEPKEEL